MELSISLLRKLGQAMAKRKGAQMANVFFTIMGKKKKKKKKKKLQ